MEQARHAHVADMPFLAPSWLWHNGNGADRPSFIALINTPAGLMHAHLVIHLVARAGARDPERAPVLLPSEHGISLLQGDPSQGRHPRPE